MFFLCSRCQNEDAVKQRFLPSTLPDRARVDPIDTVYSHRAYAKKVGRC